MAKQLKMERGEFLKERRLFTLRYSALEKRLNRMQKEKKKATIQLKSTRNALVVKDREMQQQQAEQQHERLSWEAEVCASCMLLRGRGKKKKKKGGGEEEMLKQRYLSHTFVSCAIFVFSTCPILAMRWSQVAKMKRHLRNDGAIKEMIYSRNLAREMKSGSILAKNERPSAFVESAILMARGFMKEGDATKLTALEKALQRIQVYS